MLGLKKPEEPVAPSNPGGWVDAQMGRLHQLYDRVDEPNDVAPTLHDSPNSLDMDQATRLHTRASRWVEYAAERLAFVEAKTLLTQGARDRYRERLMFKYRKKLFEKVEPEEFDRLEGLEYAAVEAEAEKVACGGWYKSLVKVKENASRTMSKCLAGGGSFNRQQ